MAGSTKIHKKSYMPLIVDGGYFEPWLIKITFAL